MNITKKTYKTFVNPIIHMIAIMFATLKTAVSKMPTAGSIIPKGTILEYGTSNDTPFFHILKTVVVFEALVTGTALKIKKGHLFNVGDTIYIGASLTVNGLDQSNADYDIITLSASASATINALLFYRNMSTADPILSDDVLYAFTNEDTEIQEGQTTLSLQMFHGVLDFFKYNELIGAVGNLAIIKDYKTVIVTPYFS